MSLQAPAGDYNLVPKVGWFWSALNFIIVVLTFGGNRRFLTDYCTTIGPWIGVPATWRIVGGKPTEQYQYAAVIHELHHVEQFALLGFGSPIVGILPGALMYVLPFPFLVAWGRYVLERAAYLAEYRALLEDARQTGGDVNSLLATLIQDGVDELSGGRYAWTWIFKSQIRRYFQAQLGAPPAKEG